MMDTSKLCPLQLASLRWLKQSRTLEEIARIEDRTVVDIERCLQDALVLLGADSIEAAKAANDARDEDLDGPVGYVSAAQRKREFAADMGIQAHSLRMAAEGAVAAYAKVLGETWKPFDRPVEQPGHSLGRKAAEAQISAFD
ncbi:hypothetical protein B5K08_24990 [Rhizobium leguminosarum bv. trifolii]|uniref:Uncharacterized protein n=2 Tax=Rhizobium TaxID=379 RepID=A0A3E1B4G3_RHILT|nr:hypothetical protein CO657_24475 [Rhizobium acidisoli]RFB85445.1 hypothetical protein B5K10_27235 [Rhizobium leguminosarum bv. trifolii]RFB86556.1 hypothetical protein B5K08_24990 [Rhizobium leguminosarum bv. trifolii]